MAVRMSERTAGPGLATVTARGHEPIGSATMGQRNTMPAACGRRHRPGCDGVVSSPAAGPARCVVPHKNGSRFPIATDIDAAQNVPNIPTETSDGVYIADDKLGGGMGMMERFDQHSNGLVVVIVHGDPLMRDLWSRSLPQVDGVRIVAAAGNRAAALQAIGRHHPDVVLIDQAVHDQEDGSVLAQALLKKWPDLRIVLLADHDSYARLREQTLVESRGWSCLPIDFLTGADQLAGVLQSAASGMTIIGPSVGGETDSAGSIARLTDRQLGVLGLVAEGFSNDVIAERLEISTRTVEHNLRDIYIELGQPRNPGLNPRVAATLAYLKHFGQLHGVATTGTRSSVRIAA